MTNRARIRKTFFSGLILLLPLWVTLSLTAFIIKRITSFVSPGISKIFEALEIDISAPLLYVLSLVIALLLIYLVGLLGRRAAGKAVMASLDRLFLRIPVLKTIYASTQQILSAFQGTKTRTFQKVVLIEYPRPGIQTLAFVTNQMGEYLTLFIPTTPNPTSGWLALMKEEDCITVDLTPDEALKLIISGGIILPKHFTFQALTRP
ncbi:MAG TPA: DUF502 domain-containing protein [Thermoanaerobaculia bacterium]|nr:DUF502 domain-containing protein [Thermoanaerobaculia bacterium]HXK66972.1 DUF502 domain-containing protein [Thermoanaerobaculia bacterium]